MMAISDYDHAFHGEGHNAHFLLKRGQAYYWSKQYDDAIREFSQALGSDAGCAEAYLYRGLAHRDRASRGQAREQTAPSKVAHHRRFPTNQMNMFEMFDEDENDQPVTELLIGAAGILDPDDDSDPQARIYRDGPDLMIEDLGGRNGTYLVDYSCRLPPFTPMILDPSDTVVVGSYTLDQDALSRAGFPEFIKKMEARHQESARSDFAIALQHGMISSWIEFECGKLYSAVGKFEEAIKYYDRILPTGDSGKCNQNSLSHAYVDLGKTDEAMSDYIELMEEDFQGARVCHFRGLAYLKIGLYDRALKDFHQAAEIDPEKFKSAHAPPRTFVLPGRSQLEAFFNEHVVEIVENVERYRALGIEFPSSMVLHGPPGCGKSFAVDALVDFLDWPCFRINSGSIGSKYIHETAQRINEAFESAGKQAPAVVVIDEMESFLPDRSSAWQDRVEEVGAFLACLQDAHDQRVLVIGMTNHVEMIDPAILRRGRFDHLLAVELPTAEEVESLLAKLFADKPCERGICLTQAGRALLGKPLSDAAFLVRESARLAARFGKSRIDDVSISLAVRQMKG